MSEIERLTVGLGVNMRDFEKDLDKANSRISKFSKSAEEAGTKVADSFSRLSMSFAALAGPAAAVGVGLWAVAKAGDEASNNMRRMEALLSTTRNTAGLTAKQIRDFARGLAADTLASTGDIERAAAKLITYNKVSGDAFKKTLELSQDLAEIGFGSLEENANRLGKALQDPITGVGALAEVGVSFTKQQREMIRAMTETNRVADAQKLILKAVEDQVGGGGGSQGGLAAAMDLLGQRTTEFMEILNEKASVAENFATSINFVAKAIQSVNEKIEKNIMDEAGIKAARAMEAMAKAQLDVFEIEKKIELARKSGMSEETINREVSSVLNVAKAKLEQAEAEFANAKALEQSVKWTREQEELNAKNSPLIAAVVQQRQDENDAIQRQIDLFQQAETEMQKRIALTKESGEIGRVNYEIEFGMYKNLNEEQQARLRWLAYEIELLGQKAEALETVKSAETFAGPQTQEKTNDQARESAQEYFDWFNKSEEERREMSKGADDAITQFKQASTSAQVGIVSDGLSKMTATMSTQSRKMFEINKVAATANAIVKTAEAVTGALALLPNPIAFPMAALAAAQGMAQVRAIQSQQFGGGGGAPAPVGGASGAASTAAASEPDAARRYIKVEGISAGQLFDSKSVRELIRQIGAELGDGVVLVS